MCEPGGIDLVFGQVQECIERRAVEKQPAPGLDRFLDREPGQLVPEPYGRSFAGEDPGASSPTTTRST
jgi:hypothetical protein